MLVTTYFWRVWVFCSVSVNIYKFFDPEQSKANDNSNKVEDSAKDVKYLLEALTVFEERLAKLEESLESFSSRIGKKKIY